MVQRDVAKAMEWSVSKLVRIESGNVKISIQDLRALLEHYGVTDKTQIEEALYLARRGRPSTAFSEYSDVLSDDFISYLAFEASAVQIFAFHPSFVSGLLQTERYATSFLVNGLQMSKSVAARVWSARAQRQQLHESEVPPQMTFFVDESFLCRRVGGASIMVEQFQHLIAIAGNDHVQIQILPFALGGYLGMTESYSLLMFNDPDLIDIAYLETSGRAATSDSVVTQRVRATVESMESLALSPSDSVAAIEEYLDGIS